MGTGEGEGENRALEAAERAIANPLLDGVSMQGAKGVIISIIGGEDMRLLEVDEAANHIRELVDPEANIIWGSAFNPELQGRIRVSVVATGIEQSAEQAYAASQPLNLGASRGPKKPVLPLPTEDELEEEALEKDLAASASDPFAENDAQASSAPVPQGFGDEGDGDEQSDEFADDADEESFDDGSDEPEDSPSGDMFELTEEAAVGPGGAQAEEELLLGDQDIAQPAAPAAGGLGQVSPQPAAPESAAPGAGSTLFERMANLSRTAPVDEEEDEDADDDGDGDGGSAMRIPRFLGRQNNQ